MRDIIGKFTDGGLGITLIIFIALIVTIALFIKEFIVKGNREKTIKLISSIAWFAVAWGFLGRTIGLIKAFDTVEAAGELAPRMLAGGFKMALVGPIFGIFVFALARIQIIILTWISKTKNE